MTDRALDHLNPTQEAPSWGLSGLLAMVLQRVQGLFLPKEESEVRQLVLDACERFGSELLASESLDDLDDRLDALLYSDAFQSVNAALLAYAFNNPRRLRRLAAEAGTEPIGLGRLFADKGLPAAKMVWEGDLLDREVLLALRPLLIAVGDEGAQAIAEESVKLEPLGFLYDASFPPEVSAGLLGSLRASACLLALGAILTRPDRVEPWLAQGLATRRREGLLAYLRTLASNPRFEVSQGVVPAADRFDWQEVHVRNLEGRRRLANLLAGDPMPLDPELE